MRLAHAIGSAALALALAAAPLSVVAQPAQEPTDAQRAQWAKEAEERLRTDWAWLGRYREENAQLGSPAADQARVVFMGDSITEGWLHARPEFFAGKPFVDRGISGQTTPQMLVRFRQDVIALKPAVVHIMAGINDIAGNTGPTTHEAIRNNIRSMAELARANGIAVVLASVLPASQFPWRPGAKPGPEVVALNDWIRAYAADNGHVYVDYWAAVHDGALGMKPEYADDGVHPTAAGYAAMEPLALRAIDEALKNRR